MRDVVPDGERWQWTLDPLVRVGPLRFDLGLDEATAALGGVAAGCRYYMRDVVVMNSLGAVLVTGTADSA